MCHVWRHSTWRFTRQHKNLSILSSKLSQPVFSRRCDLIATWSQPQKKTQAGCDMLGEIEAEGPVDNPVYNFLQTRVAGRHPSSATPLLNIDMLSASFKYERRSIDL